MAAEDWLPYDYWDEDDYPHETGCVYCGFEPLFWDWQGRWVLIDTHGERHDCRRAGPDELEDLC